MTKRFDKGTAFAFACCALLSASACDGASKDPNSAFVGVWSLTTGSARVSCNAMPEEVSTIPAGDVQLEITPILLVYVSKPGQMPSCRLQGNAESSSHATMVSNSSTCTVESDVTYDIASGSMNIVDGSLSAGWGVLGTSASTGCYGVMSLTLDK